MTKSIPFPLSLPKEPVTHDSMTAEEFNAVMETELSQVKSDQSRPDAALHLPDILEDTFALLTDFPQRVVLVDEVPWRGKGIYRLPIKNFLVYFLEWGGIYEKQPGSDSGHRGGAGT